MADLEIPRCSWCDEPIPRRGKRGPAPRYCSPAHRVAAHRARRATALIAAEFEPGMHASPSPSSAPSVDEQVARALLEARGLAGTLTRLGIEARPALAWRCSLIAKALTDALHDTIGED